MVPPPTIAWPPDAALSGGSVHTAVADQFGHRASGLYERWQAAVKQPRRDRLVTPNDRRTREIMADRALVTTFIL
jgi:hypothetical protein